MSTSGHLEWKPTELPSSDSKFDFAWKQAIRTFNKFSPFKQFVSNHQFTSDDVWHLDKCIISHLYTYAIEHHVEVPADIHQLIQDFSPGTNEIEKRLNNPDLPILDAFINTATLYSTSLIYQPYQTLSNEVILQLFNEQVAISRGMSIKKPSPAYEGIPIPTPLTDELERFIHEQENR